jgi:hypothetical protein
MIVSFTVGLVLGYMQFLCGFVNLTNVLRLMLALILPIISCSMYFASPTSVDLETLLLIFIMSFALLATQSSIIMIGDKIRDLGRYSVLTNLHYVTFDSLQSRFNAMERVGCIRYIVMLGVVPFFSLLAGLSLLVKVAQFDFVVKKLYWDWSIIDWLNILSFASNVVGIIDLEAISRKGVFKQLRIDEDAPGTPEALADAWMQRFSSKLTELVGKTKALILCATLSADDIAKVLKGRRDWRWQSMHSARSINTGRSRSRTPSPRSGRSRKGYNESPSSWSRTTGGTPSPFRKGYNETLSPSKKGGMTRFQWPYNGDEA